MNIDQRLFLKKMTPNKAWNYLKLRSSYHISKWTGKNFHWGQAFSLSIEPTTTCNLQCPECPSGLRSFSRPTGNLSEEFLTKLLDETKSHLSYLTFYFQGEPYIHPRFLDMVKIAHDRGVYTATSTNAHYLNKEKAEETVRSGLDKLIVSIDGTTQESYEQYRIGGKLDRVLEGTRNVIEAKKKLKSKSPYVVFQFLVVAPNEHQVEEVIQLGKDLGVDEVKFKSAQVYDYENGNRLIPKNEKYSRYINNGDGSYSLKHKLENSCWRMWQGAVVTWDGKVVPCCFDKDAQHQLGSAAEDNFREIWSSRPYEQFRKAVVSARNEIDICKNCTEGAEVWV